MYITHDKALSSIDYFPCPIGKDVVSNDIMVFDIETTSFFVGMQGEIIPYDYEHPERHKDMTKGGILYHWQAIIEGNYFTGRTWADLTAFFTDLASYCPYLKIIYIHNYSFEFAWLLNIIQFGEPEDVVFARDPHKPMKTFTSLYNIEFRCSYFLTQKSLAKWGESLGFPKSKDLDYNVIRTPLTPLKPEEQYYCKRDVEIMYEGLKKYREKYKHIAKIPLTLTGEVRRELRKVFKDKKTAKFYDVCKSLLPQDLPQYKFILDAFLGGLVRRNPAYSDITIRARMLLKDINSSYPWAMISEQYPLTPFVETTDMKMMKNPKYTYIVEFTARNVETKIPFCFLSSAKIKDPHNVKTMNGSIATAKSFRTILTKPDFEIFKQCYKADIEINTLKISKLGYLPDNFRRYLITCYKNKTELKGHDPILYALAKVVINSCYGIMVQKILTDAIKYDFYRDDEWYKIPLTEENFNEALYDATHNDTGKEKKMYIASQIGVFVTAYARANLMKAVLKIPDDVVYTDTDSVKAIYSPEAEQMFVEYNNNVLAQHKVIAKQLGIDPSELSPIGDDEEHPGCKKVYPIGFMDDDGSDKIAAFRTLGAKKYCYELKNGKLKITVAGVPKGGACCLDSIEDFHSGTVFSAKTMHEHDEKVKMIPYYITNQQPVTFPDGYTSTETHSICLVPTDYILAGSDDMYDTPEEFYVKLWETTRNPEIFR